MDENITNRIEALETYYKLKGDELVEIISRINGMYQFSGTKLLEEYKISFPRTVNGLKEYANEKTIFSKGTPIHVRGALIHNNRLRADGLTKRYELIREGEKIKFIFLREPNTFQSNILSFASRMPSEWNMTTVIDYDMQFEKSFIEPLKIVLDCIGWRAVKESSLEDFFG